MAKIIGTAADETLDGTSGEDVIAGFGGDDTITGSRQADFIHGGTGIDTVDYSASLLAVTVNLRLGFGRGWDAQGDTYASVESVIGSDYDDFVVSSSRPGVFQVGEGDDTVLLSAGEGNHLVFGGAGQDRLGFRGDDFTGGNLFDGGDNIRDQLFMGGMQRGVIVDGIEGTISDANGENISVFRNIEYIQTGAGDDIIYGDGDIHYEVRAGAGDDTVIYDHASYGPVYGEAGNDTFGFVNWYLGEIVQFDGGTGIDTINFSGASISWPVEIDLDEGYYTRKNDEYFHTGSARNIENVITGDGRDLILGSSADNILSGMNEKDDIFGAAGDDTLLGGNGDDLLNGGLGNDTVEGGAGNDDLNGGAGDDVLNGGAGNDTIRGQGGLDTYVFAASDAGQDIVVGFDAGETLILNDFGYADEAEAAGDFVQDGGNVVFENGDVSVTFVASDLDDILAGLEFGVTSAETAWDAVA